ncbi:hypothetical protein WNY63_14450 [Pseudoalteromonas neustonica]|uniref:Uncharacterized protein n=1 Tax=Pseudoalteromonas neustonica TaxID=1840331 RepID=A0ABU9U4H2_9GAMM
MKLYRGVNIGLDKINKGNIIPKSNKIDAVLSAGELAGRLEPVLSLDLVIITHVFIISMIQPYMSFLGFRPLQALK